MVFWVKLPNVHTLTKIHEEKDDFCEYCNKITKITIKSIEFRSVLGSKFDAVDFTIMCNQCKNEGDLNKNEKKKLMEEFLQRKQQNPQEDIVSKGFTLYENGKYDDAIKLFDGVLSDMKNDLATYGKANCLISLGKYDEASELARYLESRYPKSSDVSDVVNFLHKKGIHW
jgi:tetratricopeptide (TPR) repeat protein